MVQFSADTEVAAGRIQGRVEHVASCASARFASVEELFDFVARALDALEPEAPEEDAR